tara:strand:+ start:684 stop:2015 length:1332 start_codon:yes stop_codon:yes gene_type:complete
MKKFDTIISRGTVVSHRGESVIDVGISNGKIAAIGNLVAAKGNEIFDAKGLHILPGLIDTQVHFREPGMVLSENIEKGTCGAVLGGITGVFEMPNTIPPTDSAKALNDKIQIAETDAWCNFAFYIGGTKENADELHHLEKLPGCCGIKVFMGASTGNLLVPDDITLSSILKNGFRRVAVHCEDNEMLRNREQFRTTDVSTHATWRNEETALIATQRLVNLARLYGRRIHVLHVTTKQEIELLKANKDIATVEVTPQHLTLFSPDCYSQLGTKAQMNPPIRGKSHKEALWDAISDGVADIIGSDHAPHTLEEKNKGYPYTPSGMPGVQTTVPIMLDHVSNGKLSLINLIDMMCYAPVRFFGLVNKGRIAVGYDADLTIVDLKLKKQIADSWIASKCGWTPYHNKKVCGWPVATVVGGTFAMKNGELLDKPKNKMYKFFESGHYN